MAGLIESPIMAPTKPRPKLAPQPKRPPGNQTLYTPELAAEVCERLANGETLLAICRDKHMPSAGGIRSWVLDDREGFADDYARARQLQMDNWADELLEIANDGSNDWMERHERDGSVKMVANHEHISRSKLRIDTKKWLMSKVFPRMYADKLAVTDPDGQSLTVNIVKMTE